MYFIFALQTRIRCTCPHVIYAETKDKLMRMPSQSKSTCFPGAKQSVTIAVVADCKQTACYTV